ncbi:hypothetical protein DOT_2206 [Desulfosporosinus sp. OT]|nr:hypothetical protein DOT_2206 [Desulfosporosinus sp. OT]
MYFYKVVKPLRMSHGRNILFNIENLYDLLFLKKELFKE